MKLTMSDRDKKLLFLLALVLIAFALYFFGYEKIKEKTESVEKEVLSYEDEVKVYEQNAIKLSKLNEEVDMLRSALMFNVEHFYGTTPQEQFIYLLNTWAEKSEINISKIEFTEQEIDLGTMLFEAKKYAEEQEEERRAKNGEATEENNEEESNGEAAGETENVEVAEVANIDEESVSEDEESDDIEDEEEAIPHWGLYFTVTFEATGEYKQFKKLMNLIDKNKERIVVEHFELKRISDVLLYSGVESISTEDLVEEVQNNERLFESFSDTGKKAIKDFKKLEAIYTLKIYTLPSIYKYRPEPEFEHNWELVDSEDDPIYHDKLFYPDLVRREIHKFETEKYVVKTEGISSEVKAELSAIGHDNFMNINYVFDDNSNNPKIYVDLKESNIVINEQIEELGLSFYSDNNHNGKVSIVVEGSDSKEHLIEIANEIYFKGWATIGTKINNTGDLKYPLKLKRIVISQEGKGSELVSGTMAFNKIFVGEKPVEPKEQ